jgi:5'-3' exonuclease
MRNIILVDTSYTSFHRFYATLKWYSFAYKDEYKEIKGDKDYDFTKNKIFIEKYEKMYLEAIKKLVKNKVFKDSLIIFCQDSPQDTIWRHEYIKCYKGKRQDHSKKINIKAVFRYTYKNIIPNLVKQNNIFKIMIPKMEGDDVIALCSKFIKKKYPNKIVYIISGDKDFYQLGYNNLYFADYKNKGTILNLTKSQAKEELRKKIVNGDCSDNIPPIYKNMKLSKKEKDLILNNKIELVKFLNDNKQARKRYIRNRKVISFKYIPKIYQKKVYKIIKKLI